MLVITGIFENERFIPDKPVSIPQRKKVKITIEEETHIETKQPIFTAEQINEWSKTPEIQSLIGILKGKGLPADMKINDIRNQRLAEKYKI